MISLVLLAVAAPAPNEALAASVTDRHPDASYAFRAKPGESNRLRITEDDRGRVLFRDRGAPLVARGSCVRLGRHRARCGLKGERGVFRIVLAQLRDRSDRVRMSAEGLRLSARGGRGADYMVGAHGTRTPPFIDFSGEDELSGGRGNDRLRGRSGEDRLFGGPGHDRVSGGGDRDFVSGQKGADNLRGGRGRDRVRGGRGNDVAQGGDKDDALVGGRGNDRLHGGRGDDLASGGPHNDRLKGGPGDDFLPGGDGSDHIRGGKGSDNRFGLSGGDGADRVNGDNGDDIVRGGSGADRLKGGDGDDTIISRPVPPSVYEDDEETPGPDRRDIVDCGPGADLMLPDVRDSTSECTFSSVWEPVSPSNTSQDLDDLLSLLTQPDIEDQKAAFLVTCEADEGCRGTLSMIEAAGAEHEEIGSTAFDLPRHEPGMPPQEIEVDFPSRWSDAFDDEQGLEVAVRIRAEMDRKLRDIRYGYRARMRDDG